MAKDKEKEVDTSEEVKKLVEEAEKEIHKRGYLQVLAEIMVRVEALEQK